MGLNNLEDELWDGDRDRDGDRLTLDGELRIEVSRGDYRDVFFGGLKLLLGLSDVLLG